MTAYAEAFDLPERVSFAEYLRREEASEVRHEFHDGEVLAMSGGTDGHSLVKVNVYVRAFLALQGKPCQLLDSDMRVGVLASNRTMYPDATIVCGGPEFHPFDPKRTTIVNPRVLFEVLSESTERYDRNEKFEHYKLIPTFEEYVLISQKLPAVEVHRREADGSWSSEAYVGFGAVARVRCVDIELRLADLYVGLSALHGPAFAGRDGAS